MRRILVFALLVLLTASRTLAADLTITAASVVPYTSPVPLYSDGTAGATITAGQPVYLDSATNTYKLSLAAGTATEATAAGIAVNGASAGQPVRIQTSGDLDLGATLTVGRVYVLSANAGKIAPVTDLASTNRVT